MSQSRDSSNIAINTDKSACRKLSYADPSRANHYLSTGSGSVSDSTYLTFHSTSETPKDMPNRSINRGTGPKGHDPNEHAFSIVEQGTREKPKEHSAEQPVPKSPAAVSLGRLGGGRKKSRKYVYSAQTKYKIDRPDRPLRLIPLINPNLMASEEARQPTESLGSICKTWTDFHGQSSTILLVLSFSALSNARQTPVIANSDESGRTGTASSKAVPEQCSVRAADPGSLEAKGVKTLKSRGPCQISSTPGMGLP